MGQLYASLIRAAVRGDGPTFDWVVNEIERCNASAEFLGAAFHVALRHHFASRDPAAVIRFVGEMRADSDRSGDDIDPVLAERAIRCVLDGSEPDAPFDADQLAEIEYLAVVKILRDADISAVELDDFLADCDALLSHYLSQKS